MMAFRFPFLQHAPVNSLRYQLRKVHGSRFGAWFITFIPNPVGEG